MSIPERIALVGTGQIGTMLGLALTRIEDGPRPSVSAWDSSPAALSGCMALGAADRALDRLSAVLESDLVLVAVPARASLEVVAELGPRLRRRQLLMDAGSAKVQVVAAMERWVPATAGAVGGHPICGGTGSGPAAAEPERLRGATFALCPVPGHADAVEPARELVEALGAIPVVLPAAEHDRTMARTSHLPHLLAAALAELCRGDELMSGGGLRGAARLALSDPEMVASFVRANLPEVRAAANQLQAGLEELLALAEAGERELGVRLGRTRVAAEVLVGGRQDVP